MSRALKAVLISLAVVGAVVLLFTVVFPWVDQMLADPTMGVSVVPIG